MAKKRVLFKRIESENERKSSLQKKSAYLIKKLSELCILCGVAACVIITSPDINEPIYWPPREELEEILARFGSVPDIEKYPKSTTHESFMRESVNKLEEQLNKHLKEITRIEMNEMLHQIFNLGNRFDDFPRDKLISLRGYIEEKFKKLDKRIDYLEKSAGIGGSSSSRQGQQQDLSRRIDEAPGEAFGEDYGEKNENIITNPIDYSAAGMEIVASHSNQALPYEGMVPFDGGNIASSSGSHLETAVSHDQATTVAVGGTATFGFHPESMLGGSSTGGSSMMTAFGWDAGGSLEDASGFKALASHGGGQEETVEGNANISESDDTYPFVTGWGLAGGYVSGGLHDVVLGQRRLAGGSTSGTSEASTPPRAPGNQFDDDGVGRNQTGGGTGEASGSGSNLGARK